MTHYVIRHNNIDALRLILKTSLIELEERNKAGYTALHEAVLTHSTNPRIKKQMIELLLTVGANPDAATAHGDTALQAAAMSGDLQIVTMLLKHGADPDGSRAATVPPLHYAVMQGHPEIVRELLDGGADANKRDKLGKTPLYYAEHFCKKPLIKQYIKEMLTA